MEMQQVANCMGKTSRHSQSTWKLENHETGADSFQVKCQRRFSPDRMTEMKERIPTNCHNLDIFLFHAATVQF